VKDYIGASDPRLTEPGGLHAGIELIAVTRGELPERHLAEGGLEVALSDAHPVGPGGGPERRRGQELIQQVPEGDPTTSVEAAASGPRPCTGGRPWPPISCREQRVTSVVVPRRPGPDRRRPATSIVPRPGRSSCLRVVCSSSRMHHRQWHPNGTRNRTNSPGRGSSRPDSPFANGTKWYPPLAY
jgi:hypothetical protein